ncbi:hypothetical protein ACIQAC_18630 [Streptomyces sp. NPDC088387]|uniref:hypothetical protein n=1 Tax=Streptomyces sp. NPDC088387 TaxID=3365859 RepID=UPI0038078BA1
MRTLRDAAVTAALFVVYVLVFVPLGVVARLFHDPLARRPAPDRASYWHQLNGHRPPAQDSR